MRLLRTTTAICVFALVGSAAFAGGQKEAAASAANHVVKFALYMYSTDYAPIWNGIVADFERANPSTAVQMEVLDLGVLKNKVITEWSAGTGPDVVLSVPDDTIDMYALGLLENLAPRFQTWSEADQFYPWALSGVTIGGDYPNGFVWGVPIDATMRALVYRKDIFAKYGYTTPPTTWQQLEDVALKITQGSGGSVAGFGFCSAKNVRTPQEFNVLLWQLGATIAKKVDGKWQIGFTEDQAAEILKGWWATMVNNGTVPTDDLGWGWQQLDQAYATGTIAAAQDGPWMKFYSKDHPTEMDNTAFAPVPTPPGGTPATFLEVEGAVMSKAAKDKDAAWQFLKFIGGEKPIEQLADVVKLPPRKDVAESAGFKGNKWITPWIEMADYGQALPGISLSNYNLAMETAIGEVVYKTKTPEEAASEIVAGAEADIKAANGQ